MDWNACIICRDSNGDLRCPVDSLQKNGFDVYENFLKIIEEFKELNAAIVDLNFKEEGTAQCFLENKAKWRKHCSLIFTKSKLEKAKHTLEKK